MDNEKRLAEIEVELEALQEIIIVKQENDPFKDREDFTEAWELFCAYMKPEWKAEAKLGREKRMLMTPEFSELSTYGNVMTLKEFIECVEDGGFIDYDGWGNYVRDGKESNIMIKPSDVKHNSVRTDFDTIIWFNR